MTYNVFSGTLNLTQLDNYPQLSLRPSDRHIRYPRLNSSRYRNAFWTTRHSDVSVLEDQLRSHEFRRSAPE